MPLMTFEQYEALDPRPETPHTFVIKSGSNVLYYFGERHSFDPAHPEWMFEKTFWQSFLRGCENQKKIVFVEGRKRAGSTNENEAILKDGGMGFITYLASQEGIDTYCPEPDRLYERQELLKRFSREESQYYYFARVVGQWNRKQEPKPDFDEYINGFLESDKRDTGWNNFDFTLEKMKEIHTALFHIEFDKNDLEFFHKICNPTRMDTIINKVARASCEIRDISIVRKIEKYINEGYSVYVQFGGTHAVMQEPLLREILA